MPKLTKETAEELKAKYSSTEIRKVATKISDVVLRAPTKAEWTRMQDETARVERRAEAGRTIVRACVVWPEKAEFNGLLEKQPGLTETLLPVVYELGGVEDTAQGEEL